MPANVTPDYLRAEEAFRAARTVDEKITRLEDMIALLPKHKGTDHLFADLKRKLAKLKEEAEQGGHRGAGARGAEIEREGAGQVVMIGPPGAGKSSILKALTRAEPEIGDWPFVTRAMMPGMARFEDVGIQLIDTPAVAPGVMPVHLLSVVRAADGALLVADLCRDLILEDLEAVFAAFEERHVRFVREPSDPGNRDEVRTLVVAAKADCPGAVDRLALLREMFGGRLDVIAVRPAGSAVAGELSSLEVADLPGELFRWLRIVRVYTKIPGQKFAKSRPYTVFKGGTVEDICRLVHKDFAESLRFARLWPAGAAAGSSPAGREPVTVSKSHQVGDCDVVELHR